ncbi:MAG: MerR family transcriptional regulator [Oscillospiraceae bacterium]|nr:MerR family transcriptional regulator [Oscillospiraceae bacterium]
MTIKEIEQATGLPRASVRFYESEGLISPGRGENGYRNYSPSDLDNLLKIRLLRQLDIPLEDIHSLQNHQRSLDSVLDAALDRLDRNAAELERARTLCRTLRRDCDSYSTLNARPYLQQLEHPEVPRGIDAPPAPQPTYDRLPEAHCPFRRYFARNLDFFLYNVLFMLFCQLALRINIASGHPLLRICTGFLAPLGLTFLLEPLLLHFFCTTPGKFLFGLKITRGDGSPLSLKEAFARTTGVLVRGVGLNIPIVADITQGYSLWQIYKGRPLGWDYDLDEVAYWDGSRPGRSYWESSKSFLKLLAAALLIAGCFFILFQSETQAMAPIHRGDMTVSQFVENYNDTRRFRLGWDERLDSLLTDSGAFEELPAPNNVIIVDPYDEAPPLVFDFGVESGDGGDFLREVSFAYHVENVTTSIPVEEMAVAVWSLLYGRDGITKAEMNRVHNEIINLSDTSTPTDSISYHHDFDGAQVDFTMTASQGYAFASWGTLFALPGQDAVCQMDFSVKLTD